jgi:cytochrome b561
MAPVSQDRYDRVAALLHWIIGIALLGQIAFGWALGEIERGTATRALAINLHKSTGILLGLAIVLRLAWRLGHRPPAYPAGMDGPRLRVARVGHGLLYLCMIGLPLSGYLGSNFSKHGINFFNVLPLAPWGTDDKSIYAVFNGTHDALALVFTVLVAGHIAFALYHAFVVRDGLLARMSLGGRA